MTSPIRCIPAHANEIPAQKTVNSVRPILLGVIWPTLLGILQHFAKNWLLFGFHGKH